MPKLTLEISDEAFEYLRKRGDPAIVAAQVLEAAAEADMLSKHPKVLEGWREAIQMGIDSDDRGDHCEFSAEEVGRRGRAKLAELRHQHPVKEAV